MAGYFSNFPTVQYKTDLVNSEAKNIMLRGIMREEAKKLTLETLEMRSGDRADYLSYLLYKTPENDFLFYLLNDIVDPYYEWYLTEEQFNIYIQNKYSDIEEVHHYKKKTTKKSLTAVYVRENGGGSGYANNDLLVVGKTRDFISGRGTASVLTDSSGSILRFSVANAGYDIEQPFYYVFRRGNAGLDNMTANIVPVVEDLNGDGVIINVETYSYLPDSEQLKYEPVTNYEYERDKNYGNRLLNAIQPNIASKVKTQLKSLLNGTSGL